jgi:hypothetical protein
MLKVSSGRQKLAVCAVVASATQLEYVTTPSQEVGTQAPKSNIHAIGPCLRVKTCSDIASK